MPTRWIQITCLSAVWLAVCTTSPKSIAQQTTEHNKQREVFKRWDKNKDGHLTRSEVPAGPRKIFDQVDKNNDGQVTLAEHLAATTGENHAAPNVKRHVIRQTWPQELDGYDRELFIARPVAVYSRKLPVAFIFHGNGGQARRSMGNWPELLPNHLIVAAQGYERSWNVSDEKSKAPDVAFYRSMIAHLKEHHPEADLDNVSLIGFSNGAGFIFRLLIELDETTPIKNAVALVSSMVTEQYHENAFWKSSDDADTSYDTKTVPIAQLRRILTVHGTADRVVPYQGGMRGRNAEHLSAQSTAYAWAKHQGYQGEPIEDDDGEEIQPGIVRYHYGDANVTHFKLIDVGHGLGPKGEAIRQLVAKLISD